MRPSSACPPPVVRRRAPSTTAALVSALALALTLGAQPATASSSASPSGASSDSGAVPTAKKPNTTRVSVTTGGFHPGHGTNHRSRDNERRTVSANGRYVVFEGYSPLVKGQKQLELQIVLRDRKLGTTTLVSKSSKGRKANAGSYNPQISSNGRWIAFESRATNLVTRDTNKVSDVFLHDTKTGKTTRVSVTSAGTQVRGTHGSSTPSLSANGRYVAFVSDAPGLAPGDSKQQETYLYDRVSKKTELVSLSDTGHARSVMENPSVNANGTLVAFVSLDGHSNPQLYVRDRRAGTTLAYGPDTRHRVLSPTMSSDGRYIAYRLASDFHPADTNRVSDIYLLDRTTGTHRVVSAASNGRLGNGHSQSPAISADGRYVTFESVATNLVAKDTNRSSDVFRRDLRTGKTIRVSVRNNGKQIATGSYSASVNANGRHVVFESYGSNIANPKTGGWGQVYVRALDGSYPALLAKTRAFATSVRPGKSFAIKTVGIAAGQKVTVSWKPRGATKGKTVTRTVKVKKSRVTVKAPRSGSWTVTVKYDRFQLAKKVVRVR